MTEHDIALRLQAVVGRAHLPLDEACREKLARVIDHGIARLRDEDQSQAAVERAVDRLRSLIDDMTQQARILRFDALHEPNLISALERLCPLPPFC